MAKARIGRPRSEKSREAILTATHDLLREKGGARLTIEAIARRAEVGKPTIYRWWPSLADIVLEGLLLQADSDIPIPESRSLRLALGRFLSASMQVIQDGAGIHLRFLMAQAQQDEAFRERFRDHFTAQRRGTLRSIFDQAVERGEVNDGRNLELIVDMVFGAMWYRLLTGHANMDQAFARELTEMALDMARAEKP